MNVLACTQVDETVGPYHHLALGLDGAGLLAAAWQRTRDRYIRKGRVNGHCLDE